MTAGWQQLESIADSLAALIGQSAAAEPLRIAAFALGQSLDRSREPTDDELASIFRVSPERIGEITAGLRAEIDHLTFSLVPAVACLERADEARKVEAASLELATSSRPSSSQSSEGLRLIDFCPRSAPQPGTISKGARDPARRLQPCASRELGRPSIHYIDEHEAAFRGFVAANRHRLLDALRLHFLSEFTANRDLGQYVKLRLFPGLVRDPGWLETSVRIPRRGDANSG